MVAGSGSPWPLGALAFDQARGELVHRTGTAETWVHDGDRWEKRAAEATSGPGPFLLADDPVRRRVVQQNMVNGQTLEWDGLQWVLRTTNTSLISDSAVMAYDRVRQRSVLSHWIPSSSSYHTWEWDGAVWTRLDTNFWTRPNAMTFAPNRGRVVGIINASALYEWTGSTWQLIQNNVLPTRTAPDWTVAYDERRQRMVFVQSNAANLEVFEWDGATLLAAAPPAAPVGRRSLRTVWDPVRERVVCCGGEVYPNWLSDCWEWDGASWTERDEAPLAGRPMTMARDPNRDRTVVFGSVWSTVQSSTWEWDGHRWHHVPTGALPVSTVGQLVYDDARARMMFCGTNGANLANWTFDGASFTPLPSSNTPSARTGFALIYDSNRQEVLMVGGTSPGPNVETWRFDGTNWMQATPAVSPSARADHAMAYDPSRDRTILFGGSAADTWEWNGTTWLRRFPATAVTARFGHAMAYDPQRSMVVMTGGGYYNGPPIALWARPAELFEWNGTDWQRRATTGLPATVYAQLTHDGQALLLQTGMRERRPSPLSDLVTASTTYRLVAAPAASVTSHGIGCAGALGVPSLDAQHVPYVGNPTFSQRVTSVAAATPVVLAYGDNLANIPLAGACSQLLTPIFASDFALTGNGGVVTFPLAIPNDTGLLGYVLVTQAAVLDGVGAYDGVAVTKALRLTIGH